MWTIGSLLELSALKYPRRPALIGQPKNQRFSYQEWDEQVNRLAHGLLKLGLARGDRVATFLGNTIELVTVLFATAKIGGVFNPVNYQLSSAELTLILNDAEAKILFYGAAERTRVEQARSKIKTVQHFVYVDQNPPEFAVPYHQLAREMPATRPGIPVSEDDWYAILYTSGTTRKPKGVIHRHRGIVDHSLCMIQTQKLTCYDRGLSLTPLYHVAELHAFFIPRVHVGAANIILQDFDPGTVLRTLEEERITITFADPPRWGVILQQAPDQRHLRHLRLLASGGATMHPTLTARCLEVFQKETIHYYGATEMGPVISVLYPGEPIERAGSAGQPLINHEVRVVRQGELYPSHPDDILAPGEKGEVLVQGVGMMQGYYNHPELTAEALYGGWYHTGDIGYFDDDGYLWLVGRRDDTIIAGVDNIYPREIEDVLLEHPDILEAAVIGLEKQPWETIVMAIIVSKTKELTAGAVEGFLRRSQRLADYKIPRIYRFVDELPKVTTGKVQKRMLIQQYFRKDDH